MIHGQMLRRRSWRWMTPTYAADVKGLKAQERREAKRDIEEQANEAL